MKQAIFTVDVEGHVGHDPVRHLIWGKTGSAGNCGIDLLMDILDANHVAGLFFVDIAEAWRDGDRTIAAVLEHIRDRGHDIGVHIHPDHMADKGRLFLYEYSDDEQYEIISKCTEFYSRVVGEPPRAFRAGKYGADYRTLDILADLGYEADYSSFYGSKWCGVKPAPTVNQAVKLHNGLWEVPVSVYQSFSIPGYSRIDKMDTSLPLSEYRHLFDLLLGDSSTNPIVLFAHSFSLMDWRSDPDNPELNIRERKKLESMIEWACHCENVEMVGHDKLIASLESTTPNGESILIKDVGVLPFVYFGMRAFRYLKMKRDLSRQRKNVYV